MPHPARYGGKNPVSDTGPTSEKFPFLLAPGFLLADEDEVCYSRISPAGVLLLSLGRFSR